MGGWLSKTWLQTLLKILITALLIAWLVNDDRLNLESVRFIWQNPSILSMTLIVWFFGNLVLCGYRWISLIEALGLKVKLAVGMKLTAIGLLFNTIMPGAVGGDLVKALYVCRGHSATKRTAVLYSIFLDRVLGLYALLTIGTIGVLLGWNSIQSNVGLASIAAFVVGAFFCGLFFGSLALFLAKKRKSFRVMRTLESKVKQFPRLAGLILPLKTFFKNPPAILRAYGAALIHQFLLFSLFLQVSYVLAPELHNWRLLAAVLPAGIVATAIPLAPGGLGVGHVAFDSIYRLLGVAAGADIFNVVIFGQLALNFLGLLPYMLNRTQYTQVEDLAHATP
ncbi:MAG: lysylphosphatidylglycerol synthase transmembrane domain-containing protein [Zetaproteobacteria bacterium]|nr:lysylphosphatidylglycerol synthase transmembrane domain-containing protein [Zetaproteobacteria bacterium]